MFFFEASDATGALDGDLVLANALCLPTFIVDGQELLKRLTLEIRGEMVHHVFHPVFPPDRHPEEVLEWLRATHGEPS